MALTVTNVNSLSLLNILNRTSLAQSQSLTKLSTGYKINQGSDDPAGLIAASSIESRLTRVEGSIENNQRSKALLNVVDSSVGEVSKLLTEIQSLAQKSASSAGISASERAANQSQIDDAIAAIDRIVGTTEFNGRKLLDGTLAINTSGVTSSDLTDVQVFSRNAASTSATNVTVRLDSAATRATQANAIVNSAAAATSISIQGSLGTAVIDIAVDENLSSITAKINQATAQTGVVASQTGATAAIGLRSQNYGSSQFVKVSVLSGGDLYGATDVTGFNVSGTDASVSVNGQSAAVDGLNVSFSAGGLSLNFNISSTFNSSTAGTTSSFTVTATGGATFQLGADSSTRTTIGIDGLFSQQLGSSTNGYLTSLKSGGANSVLSNPNNAATAATIAGEAISQISRVQGRIGGFAKFQVDTALNQANATKEGLTSALSTIRDTDFASESANLNRQNVLLQSAIQLLGLANQQTSQVLGLLR
ncbi:MAG: flagellin [Phycisphaerae bacterium]